MKIEMEVEGKVLIIEAEGLISVHIRDGREGRVSAPVAVPAAPVAAAPAVAPVAAVPVGAPVAAAPSAADDGLFARLSALRRELADAAQMPPYVIFQNKALQEMAEKRPQDLRSLSLIPGVGQNKLEKYGAAFLAVINEGVAA